MNKNTIVITGANGGIGQTLIKGFYNAGFNVAAIDIVGTVQKSVYKLFLRDKYL